MNFSAAIAKPANIIVPVILFILLTPGLLLCLPNKNSTILVNSLTHAAIFALAYLTLRTVFSDYY